MNTVRARINRRNIVMAAKSGNIQGVETIVRLMQASARQRQHDQEMRTLARLRPMCATIGHVTCPLDPYCVHCGYKLAKG